MYFMYSINSKQSETENENVLMYCEEPTYLLTHSPAIVIAHTNIQHTQHILIYKHTKKRRNVLCEHCIFHKTTITSLTQNYNEPH